MIKNILLVNLLLLNLIYNSFQFNYLTFNLSNHKYEDFIINKEVEIRDKYNEDLNIIKESLESDKKTVCLTLVRNILFTENKDVIDFLKLVFNNKQAKNNIFDYIIMKKFQRCLKTIIKEHIISFTNFNKGEQLTNFDFGPLLDLNKSEIIEFINIYNKQLELSKNISDKLLFSMLNKEEKDIIEFMYGFRTSNQDNDNKENEENEENEEENYKNLIDKEPFLDILKNNIFKLKYSVAGFFSGGIFSLICFFIYYIICKYILKLDSFVNSTSKNKIDSKKKKM